MYSQCWIYSLLFHLLFIDVNQTLVLHIGALFDFEHPSNDNGRQDLRAAQFAIDEINTRRIDLFNGRYTLQLLANHSQCDPVYAVDAFFHAIFRHPKLLFLVGTSCSNETKAVIQVADYYNLILFSHSTSFISQVNQSDSTLVRLSVSDENYNDARVALIKENNWTNVAIIHQDSTEYSLMVAQLAKRLNESNINIILTQSASWVNLTSALQTLREKKARIVFVNFDTATRPIFFCAVYQTFEKELRERYVWILTENDSEHWPMSHNHNCTKEEILDTARTHIIIDSSFERKSSIINPSITAQQLQERLRERDHLDRQTLHAYDAIWTIALLIRASIEHKISIENFTYASTQMRNEWLTLLEEIHFLGVSGPVSFRNRQRNAETTISQYPINLEEETNIRIIAEYSHSQGFNRTCSKCQPLIWLGAIPVDTERNEIQRVVLNAIEITLITIACFLGLALAIFFLTFNIIYRHERYIKLSSPKLNNVMVIGAMHIHIAILLFALDQWFLEHNLLGHACMLRIFLFSGGFSLTFGSMFLKTLRVYRIFTSHDRPLLHSKLLQDHYLLLICLYIYTIDVICTLLWQFLDPHSTDFTLGPIKHLNVDTSVQDEIYFCKSAYRDKILFVIYLYKSLFLIMGGYLAAKTRHVHISALNDSKFIVWSIYIVVLTSLFTFIVMILIQNLRIYVVLCFVVVIMTSVIMCLIFLPKVLKLNSPNRGEVVSKELYMGSSRTRRLAVEITCFEAYRYAQLQNQELKNELVRLTHTLTALQQKYEMTASNLTMALFPLAVRLASTFLQKTDLQSSHLHLNNKSNIEMTSMTKDELSIQKDSIDETDNIDETSSSQNLLSQFERTLSSSSEFNPSITFRNSSLSLTALDNEDVWSINDDNLPDTSLRSPSDDESMVYQRLPDELRIVEATMDSDFDQLGQS